MHSRDELFMGPLGGYFGVYLINKHQNYPFVSTQTVRNMSPYIICIVIQISLKSVHVHAILEVMKPVIYRKTFNTWL